MLLFSRDALSVSVPRMAVAGVLFSHRQWRKPVMEVSVISGPVHAERKHLDKGRIEARILDCLWLMYIKCNRQHGWLDDHKNQQASRTAVNNENKRTPSEECKQT